MAIASAVQRGNLVYVQHEKGRQPTTLAAGTGADGGFQGYTGALTAAAPERKARHPMAAPGIVVLTGAGISRESGLATFRDADGIWAKVRLEDVATPEAFARDPMRVQAFYDARRVQLEEQDVQPNAAHHALVRLAREYPGPVLVVTQNVDDLHDRAGQPELLHMHGELLKARCLRCEAVTPFHGAGLADATCPACGAKRLRPHVVWFGEMPLHMDEIEEALQHRCGTFASIGTSGQVYPAAGFMHTAQARGARTVELNLEPTELSHEFDDARHGPATKLVTAWVEEVLAAAPDRARQRRP